MSDKKYYDIQTENEQAKVDVRGDRVLDVNRPKRTDFLVTDKAEDQYKHYSIGQQKGSILHDWHDWKDTRPEYSGESSTNVKEEGETISIEKGAGITADQIKQDQARVERILAQDRPMSKNQEQAGEEDRGRSEFATETEKNRQHFNHEKIQSQQAGFDRGEESGQREENSFSQGNETNQKDWGTWVDQQSDFSNSEPLQSGQALEGIRAEAAAEQSAAQGMDQGMGQSSSGQSSGGQGRD